MQGLDASTITLIAGITSCVIGISTFVSGRMSKAEQNGAMETKITQALDGITKINERFEAFSAFQQNVHTMTVSQEEKIRTLYTLTDNLKSEINSLNKTNDILSELLTAIKNK